MSMGVGILGSGFMGRTWAEVVTSQVPSARLVGVSGGRRAPALAGAYGVRLYAELPELLDDPEVDIVVLATPPVGHPAQTEQAAAAGRHLLVEKPMAGTVAGCRRMVDACDRAGVTLSVVSQHRFRTVPAAAAQAVADGRIGAVNMVRVLGAEAGFWDTSVTQDAWKLDPAQQSAYASWGAHACDLVKWFLQAEPVTAYAAFAEYDDQPPPGRSAMVTYTFDGGQLAQVWMSYDFPAPSIGHGLDLLLVGRAGMIEFDSYTTARISAPDGWSTLAEQPTFDPADPADPIRLAAYAGQFEDLLHAIRSGERPATSGEAALLTTAMLESAEVSAHSGSVVRIADLDGVR